MIGVTHRLRPYFNRYRFPLVAGLASVVAGGALGSVIPWLLKRAIDALNSGAPVRDAYRIAGYMILASLSAGVFRYLMRELLNGLSRRIETDLRSDLFAHLLTLDAPYYGTTRTGELMARLTNDVSAVRMAAGPAIMYLVNTVVGGLFALGFMLHIDARLTAFALIPLIPLPLITVKLGRQIHERFESVQEHFGAMTTRVQENLAGTRIVRAYRQEADEEARFGGMSDEYLRRNMHLARLQAMMNPSFGFLGGLGAVIVLGVGGAAVIQGTITVGSFVAFGMYLAMLTWPLIALGWVITLFQRAGASMKRLDQIFDASPRVRSPQIPRTLPPIGAGGGRSLEFRDVGFHYPVRGEDPVRWVFRHVSFKIPAGETLGIVGATGSGKSALIDLISRIYDPIEGEILIDGIPLREMDVEVLRHELGVVPQESVLFGDTLRANLAYGTPNDTNVEWAADVAQLTETIADFPGGFETILGERGINLSGGQKQRAALARALARRPSIVLLDDSLSAVDTQTEAAILHALRDVLAGRTAVIASHRVSAIRDSDWIVVLDEGRVVEEGIHDELFARKGRYWELLARQEMEESVA